MKNGICRNCRQQSVFTKKADGDYAIPIRTLSVAAVYHYVCANCGYIENYILDDNKLRFLHAGREKQLSQTGAELIRELLA